MKLRHIGIALKYHEPLFLAEFYLIARVRMSDKKKQKYIAGQVLALVWAPCIVIDGIYWLWLITFRFIRIATLSQYVLYGHSICFRNNHRHCFALLSYLLCYCCCCCFHSISPIYCCCCFILFYFFSSRISIMSLTVVSIECNARAKIYMLAKAANANNYIKVGR